MLRKTTVAKIDGSVRPLLLAGSLLAALLLACALSLLVGSRPLAPATVLHALLDPQPIPEHAIVRDSRIPRTLAGLLVGAGLGAAGAMMQTLTRNPLAEPGLFGVNAGAALAVVIAGAALADRGPQVAVLAATFGALLATTGVIAIGARAGRRVDPARLALAGVALSAVLLSIARGLSLAHPQAFDRLRAWHLGTIDVHSATPLIAAAPILLAGLALAALLGPALDAIDLGEDSARALGANVGLIRILATAAIAMTAGAATAVSGGVAFVGLLAPHLMRRLIGRRQRGIILGSIPVAAVLVLLGDVLGRIALPGEMPVGVTLALIGGPALIVLARSRELREL